MSRRDYRDPVTGDRITRTEHVSYLAQGVIRRWAFIETICLVSLASWVFVACKVGVGLRSGPLAVLTWWNLMASLMALIIESVVGIGMFSSSRRDSVILRHLKVVVDHLAQEEGVVLPEEDR